MKNELLFNWIKTDEQQLNWLINYLSSRIPTSQYTHPYTSGTVDEVIRDINAAKANDSLILFVTKTKAAWNQFQRRVQRKKSHITSTLEIKKDVYKNAVDIAKKYKIPTNIAIEELIKKGCEHEAIHIEDEKARKRIKSIKLNITQELDKQLSKSISNQIPPNSLESIRKKLTSEMLERYILKVKIIKLTTDSDLDERDTQLVSERDRYIKDCKEYGIDCSEET